MERLSDRGGIALLCASVLIAPALGADEWYEHYQKGEASLRDQYWAQAIEELTQAIEMRGEPGVGLVVRGLDSVTYLPYLKLGIAYFNVGQYDAALRAFDTEESAGAIAKSSTDHQNLTTFRRLAQDALSAIVAESLEQAQDLERKGQIDKALGALERGLSVAREDNEVLARMRRLRELLEAQKKERLLEERVRAMVAQGSRFIESGDHAKASSLLRQALMLKPSTRASDLLERSQEALRERLSAGLDEAGRRALVAQSFDEAARLESEGRLGEAIERLQPVLALDVRNSKAMVMQFRIVQALAEGESTKAFQREAAQMLAEGVDHLNDGMYQEAIAAISRALTLDPGNATARNLLWRAYSARNLAVPSRSGAPSAPRLPPIIAFLNAPRGPEAEETGVEQEVRAPDFSLKGIVLSDQPEIDLALVDFPAVRAAEAGGEVHIEKTGRATTLKGEPAGNLYSFHFDRRFDLTEGVTDIMVIAKDATGLVSELTFHVRYVPSLTASPWFYPALGALGLGAAGGAGAYRAYRRGLLRKRRFNPYVAGAPVLDDDLFLGREALLARILETVHNNSILLYGERRIGKTSLQHHLRKRLRELRDPVYEFHPVYIDLEGTPEDRFFARLTEDIFEELAPLLDGARPRKDPSGPEPYVYQDFVRDVHEVLKCLRKRSSRRVKLVLLIDEVDELNNYDPRINQRLRSLFMKSFAEDLVAVVSGVGISKHWASEGSPWYNFFEEIEVKPFTRGDAADLIQRPIHGIFKLGEGVVERIIEHTDCKPYLIQKLCIALVNRMHDQGRRRITVTDVDAIGRPAEG